MNIESVGLSAAANPGSGTLARAPYGSGLAESAHAFSESLDAARLRVGKIDGGTMPIVGMAFEPLDQLNADAKALGAYSEAAVASDNTMSPGEIVDLTVRSQKFMFHSQLTANIANRVADGMQQLFRQQG